MSRISYLTFLKLLAKFHTIYPYFALFGKKIRTFFSSFGNIRPVIQKVSKFMIARVTILYYRTILDILRLLIRFCVK